MKKIYSSKRVIILIFFLTGTINLNAQMVYLPDTNFQNKLIALGYGSCITGDSIDSGCPLVANEDTLKVGSSNIYNLQGIQAFSNLRFLFCDTNNLSTLPILPPALKILACDYNQLTSLPSLPGTITQIWCMYNQLTTLPPLPGGLIELECTHNQLTSLPPLPGTMTYLTCSFNQLTSLPSLPASLTHLLCAVNPITSLPALPNSLSFINCYGSQLTSLPPLPNSLTTLYATGNQLTSLPELPDSMYSLTVNLNPNLTCLPELKRIVNLNFTGTQVHCLPNYGTVTGSAPSLSSLPLCGYLNANGCNSYYNITGKSYYDPNLNCAFDAGDVEQQNEHILLFKNGNLVQQAFTGGQGFYSFDVNDSVGVYNVQLDTNDIPFTVLCPASIHYSDTITSADTIFTNDFSLKCKTGYDICAWSILGYPFKPAHNTNLYIHAGDFSNFYGTQCATGITGTVTIAFTGPVSYVSPVAGALTPDNVSGNILTYNIPDFGVVDFFNSFNIVLQTDTFAAIGSQVCFTVTVLPVAGDNNSSNNTLTYCRNVVSSFDPNIKEVYPASYVDPAGDRWLTYTIHFQNTGTSTADDIYIDDVLDTDLDLSTFHLLAYSHQPFVQILEGGIARFNFSNINLPDSASNEASSHGYIQYKIRFKDAAPVGTVVTNSASIYFDFNAPIVTNTTVNTLMTLVGIAETVKSDLQISVFPNPTRNEFTVYSPQFTMGEKILLKVINAFGKEITRKIITTATTKLETGNLSSGIYFLRIETDAGTVIKKLVKQ
jgi:Leucine-rich repeat (LRR) protein